MDTFKQSLDFEQLVFFYTTPVLQTLLAILFGYLIYFLIQRTLNRIGAKGFLDYRLQTTLCSILRLLIILVVLLLTLGFFGVSVTTLWAVLSGALTLIAVGFVAVWSVLSNVLCSVLLILFPPFRIGDEIEIQ